MATDSTAAHHILVAGAHGLAGEDRLHAVDDLLVVADRHQQRLLADDVDLTRFGVNHLPCAKAKTVRLHTFALQVRVAIPLQRLRLLPELHSVNGCRLSLQTLLFGGLGAALGGFSLAAVDLGLAGALVGLVVLPAGSLGIVKQRSDGRLAVDLAGLPHGLRRAGSVALAVGAPIVPDIEAVITEAILEAHCGPDPDGAVVVVKMAEG